MTKQDVDNRWWSIAVAVDTCQLRGLVRARARVKEKPASGTRTPCLHWEFVKLTAVPGVARRLAHRRRCRPGDGGSVGVGGVGRWRCRDVGRRCTGADTGSREEMDAWARVKRTHLSQRQWSLSVTVHRISAGIRSVATRRRSKRRGGRSLVQERVARGDWPGGVVRKRVNFARRFEHARAVPQRRNWFSLDGCRCTAAPRRMLGRVFFRV